MNNSRRRWLIDLGNSRLKCAALDAQGRRGEIFAISHEQSDPLAALLGRLGDSADGSDVWLASVASNERTEAVIGALQRSQAGVFQIHTQARCGELRIAYSEPSRLGVDRFLSLLAACERSDGPWLIVSAGSALTVDLLGADGRHIGGLIAPMPAQMRAGLGQQIAHLDLANGVVRDFADDSADALASGAHAAAVGLVERCLRKANERLGTMPTLLITGGGAEILADIDHPRKIYLPGLVLDGIAQYVRSTER
jgi:type III pantothenate kinase